MRHVAMVLIAVIALSACSFDTSGPGTLAAGQADAAARDQPFPHDVASDATPDEDLGATDGPEGDRRIDTLAKDGLARDTSADLLARDMRVDVLARDATVDVLARDATVDVLARDATVDTGPTIYLDESFDSGFGLLTPLRGEWSWTGDALYQASDGENGNYVRFDPGATDVAAETELEIHSIAGLTGITEFAALLFRLVPGNVGVPPSVVGCYLSPDGQRLGIFTCGGVNGLCSNIRTTAANVQLATRYLLRGAVVGNQIRCALPSQQLQISGLTARTGGGVGVGTFFASATFYSLRVWEP